MKIIGVDNYNRDEISDVLICENIHVGWDTEILNYLNRDENNPYFYRLEDDNYQLYVFQY